MTNMFSTIHDAKVGHGVIRDVVVNVMDNLIREKQSPHTEHGLVSMFKDVAAFSRPRVFVSQEPNVVATACQHKFHENNIAVKTMRVNK